MMMDAAAYDERWPEWDDFIRYNPGARHRRRLTLRLIDGLRFGTVLDVGCGNAELLGVLRHAYPAARLNGADFSGEVIQRNRSILPGIPFHVLDIEKERIEIRYDLVICCEVIEHLRDRRAALANLREMVGPGGHLAITCPTGPVYATERHFGHTTHPDVREIEGHAQALGLRIEKMWNWGWPTYAMLKWATNVNSEWALKTFANRKYSAASKLVSNALYYANYLNVTSRGSAGCQLFALLRHA